MDTKYLIALKLLIFCEIAYAKQIFECSRAPNGNFYSADSENRCQFYWCLNGELISNVNKGDTFQCKIGYGTLPGAAGTHNICSEVNDDCLGDGDDNQVGEDEEPDISTTTTTTSKPPSAAKKITQILPEYHAINGDFQPMISNLFECYRKCKDNATCYAFDFDTRHNACWFHTETSACDIVEQKIYCTHFRMLQCPMTSTTKGPISSTTRRSSTRSSETTTVPLPSIPSTSERTPEPILPPYIQTFTGMHLLGGQEENGISNPYMCLSACYKDKDCFGIDFDNRTNKCFFHDDKTECSRFVQKKYCTHWRVTDRCETTTGMAPTTVATTQEPTEPPTTAPPVVPTGFVESAEGLHILDGSLLVRDATLQQCLDACLMSSFCLAVDYNTITKECYAHNATNYCNTPVMKPACLHYKRAPCMTTAPNDIVEVRSKFHVKGGQEVCRGCSVEECLMQCSTALLGICQGVDYDERIQGCFVHRANTVCNPLEAKDFCTHYTRVVCTTQTGGPATVFPGLPPPIFPGFPTITPTPPLPGIPAPVGMFTEVIFMGPSFLPSGWSAYPGMYIMAGTLISGPGIDGDTCRQVCQARQDCFAVDFKSTDGTCYGHLDEVLKCDILSAMNDVYHMKKPPVCSFFPGTLVPYETPFAVAP